MRIGINHRAPTCAQFWNALLAERPGLHAALARHSEASVTSAQWTNIQSMPGFDEGPPLELLATDDRITLEVPPDMMDAIRASAERREVSVKAEVRALLGVALREYQAVVSSVARAISIDGKPTEEDRKRAYAALSCAKVLPDRK
jgi:hypothetical protein